jgi:hypothetical protein
MRPIHRASSRASSRPPPSGYDVHRPDLRCRPAWAHVHVAADHAAPGSTAVLTFQVPGESETGA